MGQAPTPAGLPDFHDSLEFLRRHHHLSRESAAQHAGISTSYLNRIAQNRKLLPGRNVVTKLAHSYGLDPWQQRHLHELWEPSAPLTPADELRHRLTSLDVQRHLDHLDTREILAVYIDPLATVLHGNQTFHRTVPGLADADNNLALWMFTLAARRIIDNWNDEARLAVTILRGALGRYRDLPRAQHLFRTLRADPEFTRLWESTTLQVAYGRRNPAPIRLHTLDADEPFPLSLEISEFADCTDVLIAYGIHDTPRS
ncbi:helix-turn-helix domain-containing protein [Nocardia pneumoniae]|uniref:helix-turn-helix domain-containing protein n=1 Tax=Nocardia pneumoniae TaxID=228601 RepID=UPI0002DA9C6F|nr:helix-turn-helix domain-containing protein [Nocardia pneumoniae]